MRHSPGSRSTTRTRCSGSTQSSTSESSGLLANPLLEHLSAATAALGAESRAYTARLPGVLRQTVAEHSAIVEAIAAGDADAARARMAAHIHRIRDAALAPAPAQASGLPA